MLFSFYGGQTGQHINIVVEVLLRGTLLDWGWTFLTESAPRTKKRHQERMKKTALSWNATSYQVMKGTINPSRNVINMWKAHSYSPAWTDRTQAPSNLIHQPVWLSIKMQPWLSVFLSTYRSTCSWLERWVTRRVMWSVGTGIMALASRGSCWSTASWTRITAELICRWAKGDGKFEH